MRKIFFSLAAFLFLTSVTAQEKSPVRVLLLGVFHFDNPGLDVAQFKNADILSADRQKEVKEIVAKLKAFAPDKIFIESVPESQNRVDSLLEQYKKGNYVLTAGERDQLGFRLAGEMGHTSVYAVDYREADFPYDSLMKSAEEAGQTGIIKRILNLIDSVQNDFNTALSRSTVSQMLLRENSAEAIRMQNDFYFGVLPVGRPGNHVGSYLVSEWWRRNMIIYENILKRLDGSEKNILVIFGAGHTAVLSQLMQYNTDIELVQVADVLQ